MTGSLNYTLITLILKKDNSNTFSDFWPIALCNLVYKIVTKVITDKLKHKLSESVSKEQFGFLFNMQILDATGVTRECLHSTKSKDLIYIVMKIDLAKALR